MGMIIRDKLLYPTDNVMDFEYYCQKNIHGTERKQLPVTWTAYYKLAKYGKDKGMIQELQDYLNTLHGKFFTVVQWDDGLLNDISHLDCLVFGMGKDIGYPLPLICTPHPYRFNMPKDIYCSFIGKNTHPIRQQIFSRTYGKSWYITDAKHKIPEFCKITARSLFGLCPRGYGITSFRIMECLQYGTIPVYISDKFQIPHNIDFNEYGVLIKDTEVNRIGEILTSFSTEEIRKKQINCKRVYQEYYTYEANAKIIREYLKNND